jgi:hypothetical protein
MASRSIGIRTGNPLHRLRLRQRRLPWQTALLALLVAVAGAGAEAQLVFNFTATGTLAGLQSSNPALYGNVIGGFATAGNYWSSQFDDNVTVNIEIDYPALDPGILGSASSETLGYFYSDVRTSLQNDSLSASDTTAVANLPGGSSLSFLTNSATTGAIVTDNNGSANNFILDVNRANAKALGLLSGTAAAKDASISFSSNFSWDFDRTNGITAGTFDFVGVALHEIGHSMGFISGVDIVDLASEPNGPFAPVDLDDFRVFSVLDLYRRSDRNDNNGGLDFAYGGTGSDAPYFSIDGGTTSLGLFSTGDYNGDGQQASHWKDNLGLGLLDPTLGPGTLAVVTSLDLQAMDVIGWDPVPVPEPSTWALAAAGLTTAAVARRRRAA